MLRRRLGESPRNLLFAGLLDVADTMQPGPRIILAFAALVAALGASPAAPADTLVHADPTAENVTAYGGVLMWSRRDSEGRHHLVQRAGAVASDSPVAPSRHPFDPDLGPGGNGRVVAVYERCRKRFQRCDLHRLDLATGRERRARGAASRGGSEFGGSVWGNRYAFAREGALREGLFTAARGRARLLTERDAIETDMRGRTIALATYSPGERVQVDFTGIYLHRVRPRGRGRSCLVDRGDQGPEEGTALNSPVLDGGHVYWHDFTAGPGIVERVARSPLSPACGRRPRIQFSARTLPVGVDSIAVDRGVVHYTQGDYVDATGVYLADSPPPQFVGG
jgi:hypothetical protein